MPLWDYKCKDSHVTKEIRKYNEREEPTVCKTCGQPSEFEQTFGTTFIYGKNYDSFTSLNRKWNLRENKRLGKG